MLNDSRSKVEEAAMHPSSLTLGYPNQLLCSITVAQPSNSQTDSHRIKIVNEVNPSMSTFPGMEKEDSSIGEGQDGKKKPSIFHNFQKHLITTLKTHITFPIDLTEDPVQALMVSLWQHFIKSNKPTKKYLYSLLINFPILSTVDKQQCVGKEVREELSSLLREASQAEIQEAQRNLRVHLMRQSKRLLEEGRLDHRRMHKLDEFKQYFSAFVQELESGELYLRLPKRTKNPLPKLVISSPPVPPLLKKEKK